MNEKYAYIRGISEVDEDTHVVIANYPSHTTPENGVHVLEMVNGPAAHMNGKLLAFGRWISVEERAERQSAYDMDPEQYLIDHLKSLSK